MVKPELELQHPARLWVHMFRESLEEGATSRSSFSCLRETQDCLRTAAQQLTRFHDNREKLKARLLKHVCLTEASLNPMSQTNEHMMQLGVELRLHECPAGLKPAQTGFRLSCDPELRIITLKGKRAAHGVDVLPAQFVAAWQ